MIFKQFQAMDEEILRCTESFGISSFIFAPGLVKPGHIICEPLSTNFIAPLST